MGCGASRAAMVAERYRIEQRDLMEAMNPRLKLIRLADEEIASLWEKLDVDGDGSLEIPEIAMILVDLGRPLSTNQIESVVEQIDTDRSGQISRDEFVAWYKDGLANDWEDLPVPVPKAQRALQLHERVLTQVPIFAAAFNDNAPRYKSFCAELATYFTTHVFAPQEMFIRKGDTGNEMYMIVKGTCDILLSNEPGTEPVDTIGPGDIVGEGSLFSAQTRTAAVRATATTHVLVLSRAAVDAVLPRYPRVHDQMDAFREGRLDGRQKGTAEERREEAKRRARSANKAYGNVVFEEFYNAIERGSVGAAPARVASPQAALDASSDDAESPVSLPDTPKVRLDESLIDRLKTPVAAKEVPPLERAASPLKQALLTQPKLTPRSEALRHDFESGVAELSSQLLDLSTSVSDINASLSAENSRASLNGSTASAARNPNAEMMEALEQILLSSKEQVESRIEGKLHRVEKSCYRLSDTFKSTFNEELASQQGFSAVEDWLDERGLGRSSKYDCVDEMINHLQMAQYHPTEWLPLLNSLTQEQLLMLAEEAAWQVHKRKRKKQKDEQQEARLRLLNSGLLKECSKIVVHGVDDSDHRVENLRAIFEKFGCVQDVTISAASHARDKAWAVVNYQHTDEAKAAVMAFKNGNLPDDLTVEFFDRMTERTRGMTRPQKHWQRLKVMWHVGVMIQMFISGAEHAAELRRNYDKEQKEAERARLEFEREQEEAKIALKQAEEEQQEAQDAMEKSRLEEAEMEAAERDLQNTLKQIEHAEQTGLSVAAIAQLKRIAKKKKKVLHKEKQEADHARRQAELERAEAEDALENFRKEEEEARVQRLKYEKELLEAEVVMRIGRRLQKSSRSTRAGHATSKAVSQQFELPPEIAVQQYERNLKNYRRNALNYADAVDASSPRTTDPAQHVSVRAKIALESEVTASILDGLSQNLMRLDPPQVVAATLRAAEAELIRSRLEHADDQMKGLANASKLQITKLGSAGGAQMLWKDTLTRASRRADESGPHSLERTFVDD